ncbi:MAG: HIT family protein [Polyangiales bacterium]
MPTLIPRAEALARIREEGGSPACLMCAIRDRKVGATHVVHEDEEQLVSLPRYVRRWGQITVTPKAHVTSYLDVDDAVWATTNALALHAARVVERVMKPRRCYLASTGSSAGELTQTSMHLHIHVIPLYLPDDKPADIFSWSEGVYVAEPEEWEALRAEYVRAW